MGDHRTVVTSPSETSATVSGAQAARQSQGPLSDSVRPQDRGALGTFAAGTRLGVGNDCLATTPNLAKTRDLAENPCRSSRPSAGSRSHRLVASDRRFLLCPCGARGKKTGSNPTDRRKSGSKHHLVTDASGIPLAATLTAANAHDVTQLIPVVDAIPAVRGKRGRPRRRPVRVQGDRAYDSEPHRRQLRRRGIVPVLAKRRTEHGSGLGKHRWVVERTLSWLHQMRRLRIRCERRDDIHNAFLTLGCIVICGFYL